MDNSPALESIPFANQLRVIGMIQILVSKREIAYFQITRPRDPGTRIDVQSVFELDSTKSVVILVLIEEDRYGEPYLESAGPSGVDPSPAARGRRD